MTEVFLTGVGIVDREGLICKGYLTNGDEVKFAVTQEDMDALAGVLYTDLAGNFTGVTVEVADIIEEEA